ncbi:MAG TPA: sugar kinase [Chitinophagaceae bacterium]|nr:sugar kinase [Chitinophagaceae bacterium]
MVFCFGELLLRLSPSLGRKWIRDNNMPVFVGGAELNVATALTKWGIPTKYCTALPDNYLSAEIIEEIRDKGIDPGPVHLSGKRVGLYYLPQGADMKNAGVIYDRSHSAFAELAPGLINWEEVLKGCSWFHFSAISPALNNTVAAVCREALYFASQKNLNISIDLNYRSKLWQYGKKPTQVMPELVNYCNVIMGNIWAANSLLGMPVDDKIHHNPEKRRYLDHATQTADELRRQFPVCKAVANTFRFDKGDGIHYYAALNNEEGQFVSPEFNTRHVVDKVGSGDCFMGGLIYGSYKNHTPQDVIDFAAAAAYGKLQEKGDTTNQTVQAVKKILAN